ncbi:MAG: sugar MFS transporter [Janthinobacterium lividum]
MATGTAEIANHTIAKNDQRNYALPMVLMVSLYFSIGFITALNDILVPHFKDLFHLTNVLALLVQFCFFGAYFVMSLPAGWTVNRIGYKSGIITALSIMGTGLLLFLPASIAISYPLFLFALFVVGSGLALLQVAVNPYVGALGTPETATYRLNLCGFLNSLATTLAPKLGAIFIFVAAGATTAQLARSVRAPYLAIAGFAFLLAVVTYFVPLPELIPTKEADSTSPGTSDGNAWQFVHLRFGALAIFTYVGAEVAIGSIMITFLGQPSMGSLSHAAAAVYVSLYWGGTMIGRLIGTFALIWVRAQRALAAVATCALLLVTVTLFGNGHVALWAIVSCGLFNSVMWPCIFPLSVKGLGRFTSQGSGILIMMVVGGAIIPEIQGLLADKFGYQHSYIIVLLCYAYLIFFALSGHRIRQSRNLPLANDALPAEAV